jgi:hypothetical protein
MYSNAMDVSHLIDHSDEGQDAHDALDPDLTLHITRAFAHHAGVGKDPGKFSSVVAPDAEDLQGQQRMNQSQAISNLSQGDSPEIPSPAP